MNGPLCSYNTFHLPIISPFDGVEFKERSQSSTDRARICALFPFFFFSFAFHTGDGSDMDV